MEIRNYGTAFSDGTRVGKTVSASYNFGVPGLNLSPSIVYTVSPAQALPIGGGISTGPSGGFITLGPGDYGNIVTYQGYPNVLQMDVARSLQFEIPDAPTDPLIATISGWDIWGHKVVENVTIPASNSGTTITNSKKTFLYIKSVFVNGGLVGELFPGNSFGFPYHIPTGNFVRIMYAGRPHYYINFSAGGSATYALNLYTYSQPDNYTPLLGFASGDTSTPTATTGDPRGVYACPYANDRTFSELVVEMYVGGLDPMQGTIVAPGYAGGEVFLPIPKNQTNIYGVTQYSTGWQ